MIESLRKTAAAATGLTTIYMVWIGEPLVDSRHDLIYHWSGPVLNLFGPVVLDILVVWIVLAMLLLSARRPGRWRVVAWSAVVFFAPSIGIRSLAFLNIVGLSHLMTLTLLSVATLGFLLVTVLWRPVYAKQFDHAVDFASTVLGFVGILGCLLLGQAAWFGWQARSLNKPLVLHMETATTTKPRIIWFVLDELSYQQVYERRLHDLQLPAFDALAAQATVFTHAVPAGIPRDTDIRTEKIFPSLLTGISVDELRSSSTGQLWVHNADRGAWQRFEQHDTVFQDALDAGYRTGVAGWFNPYCRILPAVVDRCFWTFDGVSQNGMTPNATVASNMLQAPITKIGGTMFGPVLRGLGLSSKTRLQEARSHISDYRRLYQAADELLKDKSQEFVLIHFPLPHPWGIYNRTTGELTTHASSSSYIANLQLADKYLAHVRSVLTQSGQWDASTIVIMGDHGWRTMEWRPAADWTQEDEAASQAGHFDDRPAYIVKLAEQEKGATLDTPFRAQETRKLMDALFAQKIHSKEDLIGWVQQAH